MTEATPAPSPASSPAPVPVPASIEDYALSVLLHDIGKFWERSSDSPRPSPADLHLFCPPHPETGGYSHVHAAFSGRFIEETIRIPGLSRWGPKHHIPDPASREESCAALADALIGGDLEPDETRDALNAATTALRTIAGPAEGGEPRSLPLVRLDQFGDSLAPRAVAPVSREDYRFHWNHFLNAIDKLGGPADLDTWCALLEVFTARIPAAVTNRQMKAIPDVDLHSHSRAVAALAAALLRGPLGLADLTALGKDLFLPSTPRLGTPLAVLAAGEVAGLRRFAAGPGWPSSPEFLRGRALLLDFVADAAARRLTARLGLPAVAVLHRDGGRFFLLAPARASLEEARADVEGALAAASGGELGLELAGLDLTLAEFRAGLGRPWVAVEGSLDEALEGRIPRIARESYDRVFGNLDEAALRPEAFAAAAERLGASLAGARFILRVRPDASAGDPFAGLIGIIEAAGPEAVEALAARPGLEAAWSLGRLDLEDLGKIRAGRPVALGFRGWPAGGALAGAAGTAPSAVAVGADGLRRTIGLGLPGGGNGLPRIIGLLGGVGHLFAGWVAAEIGRSHPDSLVLLASGGREALAAGGLRAGSALAARLREAFAALAGPGGPHFAAGLAAGSGLDPLGDILAGARDSLESARVAAARQGAAGDRIAFLGADLAFDGFEELREIAAAIAKLDGRNGTGRSGILRELAAISRYLDSGRPREGEILSPGRMRDTLRLASRRRGLAAAMVLAPSMPLEEAELLERLRERLLGVSEDNERLALIVRWAELLMKGAGR